jgi:membrane protein required for colicin V production
MEYTEGVSLLGVIVGFCVASHYYAEVSKLIIIFKSHDMYARILGFLIVFLAIVIIANALIPMIKYLVGLDFIRGVDRSLGGGFGIIKGLFVCCTILIIFTVCLPRGTAYIAESKISRYLIRASEKIISVSPREMEHEFTNKVEAYKKTWNYHK